MFGINRRKKGVQAMRRLLLFVMVFPLLTHAQSVRNPFDFPILLSGNFGELRGNHFHSGLDFKTQGVSGKPIHAVMDGYISRISISAWGYGNVLYMDHPNGTTTVYAHMLRFSPTITNYVKNEQYRLEEFTVNVYPPKDSLRFKQGEVIGLSGNTGSSAGPHLHFEIRTTETERVLDPLPYYKDRIRDTRPPRVRGLAVYPSLGKGIVNGSTAKKRLNVVSTKEGKKTVSGRIEAWGDIGFGIEAFDSMDGTSNIYGVRKVSLTVDDSFLFGYEVDSFSFEETRFLNSFIDYAWWKDGKRYFMKSFVEPGNHLSFVRSNGRGILRVEKEKRYNVRYTLSDLYGNQTEIILTVDGKKQAIPAINKEDYTEWFYWNSENRFGEKGIRLWLPRESLYADLPFKHRIQKGISPFSEAHSLHNVPIALHTPGTLSLKVNKDIQGKTQHVGIVQVGKNKSQQWIGGIYKDGWVSASIKELGQTYAISADNTQPRITPLGTASWSRDKKVRFRLTDNLSGIQSFRGEIDGSYVLFEMDNRSVVSYTIDHSRLKPGKHRLVLSAKDAAGNTTAGELEFIVSEKNLKTTFYSFKINK